MLSRLGLADGPTRAPRLRGHTGPQASAPRAPQTLGIPLIYGHFSLGQKCSIQDQILSRTQWTQAWLKWNDWVEPP